MKDLLSKPILNFLFSVITALLPVAVALGAYLVRLDNLEKNFIELKAQMTAQSIINQEIKVSLARIETIQIGQSTDILYIRQQLDIHLNQE